MGCVAFHIGFLKKESACCESLSHGYAVPAPTGREPLRPVAAEIVRGDSPPARKIWVVFLYFLWYNLG